MASFKAYQKPDGTLVVTLHGKGKEGRLLDLYGAALTLPAQKVHTESGAGTLGGKTTVRLEISLPAEAAASLERRAQLHN